MKRILASVAAIMLTLTGSVAIADPTPPAFIDLRTVKLGHNVNGTVPLKINDKMFFIRPVNCDVKWTDNDQFYLLTTKTAAHSLLVRKDLFDYVWDKSGHDWDVSLESLKVDHDLCIVLEDNSPQS